MTNELIGQKPEDHVQDPKAVDFESFPQIEIVRNNFVRAMNETAIQAYLDVMRLTGGKPEETSLDKKEKDRRTVIIDTNADTAYKIALNKSPFQIYGIDAEGGKESHVDKLGQEMPVAIGVFGAGEKKVTSVVDVVEGTGAATHGRPNAISIVAVSTHNGITKIPDFDGKPARYFRKLFAPAEFKGEIDLDKSAKQNLQKVMRVAQIPAQDITVAIMDRQCNATILRQAEDLGVNIQIVPAGDLIWCLQAIKSNPLQPILMMGRGGAEEGSIAAVGVRARNAFGQLRKVESNDDVEIIDRTPIWNADEFVPGLPEHSMVIFSTITENTNFGIEPVKQHDIMRHHYLVNSVVVDSNGFRPVRNLVRFQS